MTRILSWNIQNGRGADGITSLERIADVITAKGVPDVICLQEVSRYLPLLPSGEAPDQPARLADLFPGYQVHFGAALEIQNGDGCRMQFGNAILSRLKVLSVFRHGLPQPAQSGIRHMPRQATEVTVETAHGPLRVVNTHLEYHSKAQRLAQIGRLRGLHHEIVLNAMNPPLFDERGAYRHYHRPPEGVLCGDFNMETDSEEYGAMLSPLPDIAIPFLDAWLVAHNGQDWAPTCGIHDQEQWPQGPHARDFFFVSDGIAAQVEDVAVNIDTNASDHQPILLQLAAR